VNGVLQLYHRDFGADASTVSEHIGSFARHSKFRVWEVNTLFEIPPQLWSLRFSVVLLHYSLFGPGAYYHLDEEYLRYLAEACGESYKVAFFQDEYRFCGLRFAFLNQYDVDCVFSCLEPPYLDEVYGRHTSVSKLVSTLPGYVSADLVESSRRFQQPEGEREVDIGYRGRLLPAYTGRGGLEKYEVGVRFARRAASLGLELDIAWGEDDRLYGDDWYRFIAGCRAVLGTESGVSVFDLEGEVHREYQALVETGREVTLEQLERGALGRWEGRIPYRTLSPRHFEAAALGVCQILYEGRYSGAIEPLVDYIPLKKDFSNFDEVIERFRDDDLRRELTDNARRRLIDSGEFGYGSLIRVFDETLLTAGLQPGSSPADERKVEKALERGSARRYVRARLWSLNDALRRTDVPGKAALRAVARPALRAIDRRRRRLHA